MTNAKLQIANRKLRRPQKIGLALGGGGAKGLAHVGVIKVLKYAGIPIDYIAGTSMGAIVGGWYAATEDIEFLEEFFLKLKTRDIFPLGEILRKKDGALFRGDSVLRLLEKNFGSRKIEDCKIPFAAVATDVKNGDEVVLNKGKLADALRASSALPAVFSPVEIGGLVLFDGGLANPVPADVVRKMGADYVIAVDVSSRWITSPEEAVSAKSIFEAMSAALSVIEYQLAKSVLEEADIVLRPPVLSFSWLDFGCAADIIRIGREEAKAHLKEIRKGAGIPEPPKTFGEKFMDFLLGE